MNHLSPFHLFESQFGNTYIKVKRSASDSLITVDGRQSRQPDIFPNSDCLFVEIKSSTIKNLKGIAKTVKKHLTVKYSDLETLEGCPKSGSKRTHYSFYDNKLWTLEGAPIPSEFGDLGDLYLSGQSMISNFKKLGKKNAQTAKILDKIYDTISIGASIHFIDNLVEGQILFKGYIKWVETGSWIPYYLDLLSNGDVSDEVRDKALDRLDPKEIQDFIDGDPEQAVISLSKSWSKIKGIPKYKEVKFPEEYGDTADDLGGLSDLGF